jgi:hypothetical protein
MRRSLICINGKSVVTRMQIASLMDGMRNWE